MPEIRTTDKDAVIEEQRRIIRSLRKTLNVPELQPITSYADAVLHRYILIEQAAVEIMEYVNEQMGSDDDTELQERLYVLRQFLKPI